MKVVKILRHRILAGGVISKDIEPEVVRKRAVVSESYIERINSLTKENGLHVVVDTKATEKYEKESQELNEKREQEQELKNELASSKLAEVLGIKNKSNRRKPYTKKAEETSEGKKGDNN